MFWYVQASCLLSSLWERKENRHDEICSCVGGCGPCCMAPVVLCRHLRHSRSLSHVYSGVPFSPLSLLLSMSFRIRLIGFLDLSSLYLSISPLVDFACRPRFSVCLSLLLFLSRSQHTHKITHTHAKTTFYFAPPILTFTNHPNFLLHFLQSLSYRLLSRDFCAGACWGPLDTTMQNLPTFIDFCTSSSTRAVQPTFQSRTIKTSNKSDLSITFC